MTAYPKIILRADGNSTIGFGHIYRLLALAEMLKDDFESTFAISTPPDSVINEIKKLGIQLISLPFYEYTLPDKKLPNQELPFDLNEVLTGNEIVVLDGYWFGINYQTQLKKRGCKLVYIDDFCNQNTVADAIINHAPNINSIGFSEAYNAKFYSGISYAIIRKPFFKKLPIRTNSNPKAYIALGGSDYFGYSYHLAQHLVGHTYFEEINVLCSSSFSAELITKLKKLDSEKVKIKLHVNLNATQIVDLLDSCTHAFVSASTVLFEAYARGLRCFAGYYTDNQTFIYDGFTKHNLAIGLGIFSECNNNVIATAFKNQDKLLLLQQPLNSSNNISELFYRLCRTTE